MEVTQYNSDRKDFGKLDSQLSTTNKLPKPSFMDIEQVKDPLILRIIEGIF